MCVTIPLILVIVLIWLNSSCIEKLLSGVNEKQKVTVKVPPTPKCKCPLCPDIKDTYYPIYKPSAYGLRY